MPIIKKTIWLADHRHTAISADALRQMVTAVQSMPEREWHTRVDVTLKLLEAYLQITRQTFSLETLHDARRMQELCEGFIGAFYSSKFIKSTPHQSHRRSMSLLAIFRQLGSTDPCILPFRAISQSKITDEVAGWVLRFENSQLDDDSVWLWRAWFTENKNGALVGFPLHEIFLRFGRPFTERLFTACETCISGGRTVAIPFLKEFCEYIGLLPEDVESSRFQDPYFVDDLLIGFLRHYFSSAEIRHMSVAAQIDHWNHGFGLFVTKYLFGNFMATPARGFPMIPRHKRDKSNTRVLTDNNGVRTKASLLTHFPLELSDSETCELLFGRIQSDFDAVVRWANAETEELWAARQQRKELSKIGIVRRIWSKNSGESKTYNRWLTDPSNPKWLSNAAATYEDHGHFGPDSDSNLRQLFQGHSLSEIAKLLGLPTDASLLPYAALLVAEHPAITTAFLDDLSLFNRRDKQTGFVELDGGWYLVGTKPRRGALNAQQHILLNEQTKALVDQIIELTEPLRSYLKKRNDPAWRFLFLTSLSLGTTPHRQLFSAQSSGDRLLDRLAKRFSRVLPLDEKAALDMARRFSLRALRASAGVLVYLRTKSVTEMARALGHKTYIPKLLAHYLPPLIQTFFQDRWIRIFQSAILCEALKDSDYLLEASSFQTMDELDSFLRKHALKKIPAHLADPENAVAVIREVPSCEVIFGVSNGILAALLSIDLAVKNSTKLPSGRAIYWSGIAGRLSDFISQFDERPDLQKCLIWAREHASATVFRDVIYA
ncbi:hypothetical protein [Rhodanobacter umsongensis]